MPEPWRTVRRRFMADVRKIMAETLEPREFPLREIIKAEFAEDVRRIVSA